MTAYIAEINTETALSWPFFLAQAINIVLVVTLFVLAAREILSRGRGWEVPIWLILSFCIPIIFPILALIHFRKPKAVSSEPNPSLP